jgi:stearoyl-CoA desaturase (Delta-9 desaturase)
MLWLRSLPFWFVHVAAVGGVIRLGWSWSGLALAVVLYATRMFFVSAGYHRYFSHRTFKTSRAMQFVLAVGASSSMQKGVLWWTANHRLHHRFADGDRDPHSPRERGFWWAHVGWILSHEHKQTQWRYVRDLARYPELVWLNRYHLVPPVLLAILLYWVGGAWALVWGFFVSTTLLWHGTFTINSLAHRFGRQRYRTGDDSRNNALLALLTGGEGWHNNHHHYPSSVDQGFFWWEVDLTRYVLMLLARLGVIWDIRRPPLERLRVSGTSPGSRLTR